MLKYLFVVNGALLRCSVGSLVGKFHLLPSDTKVFLHDIPAATINHCKPIPLGAPPATGNIPHFGICQIKTSLAGGTPTPCKAPVTAFPGNRWKVTSAPRTFVGNASPPPAAPGEESSPALHEKCLLTCMVGGTIEILSGNMAGQKPNKVCPLPIRIF